MDWRNRRYFKVILNPWNKEAELNAIKEIGGIKISPYKYLDKQPDENEKRGYYTYLISIPCGFGVNHQKLAKELRDSVPDTAFSLVEEIKRDVSRKHFADGTMFPYRRCDIHPNKRCNHCMDC